VTLPIGAFLTVWTILALNILSPGPNVLNTITTAMGSGRAAGLASAAAVGLGIGLWCLSMSLGMAALFAVVPHAEEALTVMAARVPRRRPRHGAAAAGDFLYYATAGGRS
jgi:threonine efflux protein